MPGRGSDCVNLSGSTGSNRLYSYPEYSRLIDSSRTFSHRVDGFETMRRSPFPPADEIMPSSTTVPANDVLVASPGGRAA